MNAREELDRLVRALRRELARRADAGIARVERGRGRSQPPGATAASTSGASAATATERAVEERPAARKRAEPDASVRGAPPRRVAAPSADPGVLENRRRADEASDLKVLGALVAECRACGLCETRTQTVFADGDGRAKVMFIGEAPGQNEDEQGIPFVGRAGALLTDIIQKGMRLQRTEVYIANVLKCRPPGNRDPEPGEKALCTPYLDRQIELVDPTVLITLGLHASQHVLGSTSSMGKLRGRVHSLGSRKVIATYHPAFLLRSPHMKKECWKDIQLAMKELDLPA